MSSMEEIAGLDGGDLLSGALAWQEQKQKGGDKGADQNQQAVMTTPVQDWQEQAQTGQGSDDEEDGGGSIMGIDRRTALMVGGGALALVAVLALASR